MIMALKRPGQSCPADLRRSRGVVRQRLARRLPFAVLLASAVLVATAGSAGASSSSGRSRSGGVVKLGYIGSISGPLAAIGIEQLDGAKVAVEEINASGGVDGHKKIRLVTADDKLTPSVAAAEARTMMSSGIKLIFGMVSSANCLAVAPVVQKLGGVTIGSVCSSTPLVGPKRVAKTYFTDSATNGVSCRAEAAVLAKEYPNLKTIYIFGYDYITGHEIASYCIHDMKADGMKQLRIAKTFWVPLTSDTFSPQVSALADSLSGPSTGRALFIVTYGTGTTTFLKEAAPYKLLQKFQAVFTNGGYVTSSTALNGAVPKVWDSYEYFPSVIVNKAVNNRFVKLYDKFKVGPPNSWSYDTWLSVMSYAKAIDAAKSTNPHKVAAAMTHITITGPLGPVKYNPRTHQPTTPTLIFETVGDPTSSTNKLKLLKWDLVSPETNKIIKSGS